MAADEHVLHLDAVAVSPSARGLGIASQLVGAVRKLWLRALSTNARSLKL